MTRIIGFFLGPIGKWVVLATLFAGWTYGHRLDAARQAKADCQLGVVSATISLERKRADVAERIAEQARLRADRSQEELEELEAISRDLINDTEGACAIPLDTLERLRTIK